MSTPEREAEQPEEEAIIVDFEQLDGQEETEQVFPERIDLADLEEAVFVRHALSPESEPYKAIKSHFRDLLRSGLIRYGEGQISLYSVIDPERSRFPKITGRVGVRQIRTQEKTNRLTGQRFRAPFSTKEKARPLDEFMHGAAVQSIAHLKKGVLVPRPCFMIEHMGATDLATGEIIPGTEDSVTEAFFIMEHIPGLTPLQICDPDGSLRKYFVNVRKNGDSKKVFDRYGDRIRENIRRSVKENPYLLDVDFDAALEHLGTQVEALHATTGNLPGILHCDLHEENIVLHPERKLFYIIDFDEAKIAYSGSEYGRYYEDYQHYGKSIGGVRAMYMPDGPYEFQESDGIDKNKPVHALEYLKGFLYQIKTVIRNMRAQEPGSTGDNPSRTTL